MAVYTQIDDPSAYFKAQLWTGDGNGSRSITFDDTDTNMQPDFVWIKSRSFADNAELYDSSRGVQKRLLANDGEAEETRSQGLLAFNSNGFTVGTSDGVNKSSETFVAWCWKESAIAGFDINLHTGSGSSADISHNLSAVPELILTKERSGTQWWFVYSSISDMGAQKAMHLNTTNAVSTQATAYDATPTSSVINYGADGGVNGSSDTYVAYLWRSVQGFSKFGKYVGNGNADGTFVYTGFKPAFFMTKGIVSGGYYNHDIDMNPGNPASVVLSANDGGTAADNGSVPFDILSNGFKPRTTVNNASGTTYLYMAWADAPFVNSNGVPCNAR